MSYSSFDPFSYIDIKPQNYKQKQNITFDLEQILKTLENITNDWKERESALQFIGRMVKGNQGHSDLFIKYFNSKLSSSLEIQLSDLRSVVMKEACRITSLCAKELGLAIEQGIVQLLTQNCLFKIAGSANQVISESASKCILNMLRYVHSLRVISNICEIRSMKANNVRILCAQSLVNIMSYYDTGLIIKAKNNLEETIKILLVDANAEVRATTRKAFILYKNMFNPDGQKIYEKLGKSVQKQILEDEKNFVEFNMNIKSVRNENFLKNVNEIIDDNLNHIDYNELIKNKPKTPEFNNLFKNKSSQDFTKSEKHESKNKKGRNSLRKKNDNYAIGKEKKEETVKYINVDEDDIVENDDDFEEDKNGPEESKDLNMVFNYNNTLKNGRNSNKTSFTKKNQIKITDNFNNNDEKIPKDNKKVNKNNKLSQNNNINPFMQNNANDANNIIDDLIVNSEKNYDNSLNIDTDNNQTLSKRISNLVSDRTSKLDSNNNKNINNSNRVKEKSKRQSNDNSEKSENYSNTNLDKKNIILKKFNTKFDKLNEIKNYSNSVKYQTKSNNNLKEKKIHGKSREKIKVRRDEIINKNKANQKDPLKKINNFIIKNSKTIDYNTMKFNSININDSENDKDNNPKKNDKKKKEKIQIINIALDEEENDLEEEMDAMINMDKTRERTKTYNTKTENINKNKNSNIQNQNNIYKKDIKKNKEYIFNKSKNRDENKNSQREINSDNKNLQDLYKELSNIDNTNEDNINSEESLEQKVIFILDKLDNLINQSEKLILFQYLFNYFNMILREIKTFSQSTIKRYIDIHIENLKENDSNLVEQVIKNLMRMIFYLKDIFTTYDIELILKILLFSINDLEIKSLKKLSYDLLEIIKKKCDNEELFQSVYSLLGEYNTNYDDCYEFLYLLIPSCDNILKNINYFKQVFRLICLTDPNSKKVGKIIDILYRNYRDNFDRAFNEESPNNQKTILMFMEKLNSLYFREFKFSHENSIVKSISNNNDIESTNLNSHQISSSIIKPTESGNISFTKETINSKNNEDNINRVDSNNLKSDDDKRNNIIFNQNTKNDNHINTINTNLNGNNIISINNSNNNNIIITNKLPDDYIPNEIKTAIKNNDLEQYMLYIQKHKSYIPEFVLLLSNKNYSNQKNTLTLLNFTQNILTNSDFCIDLNTCISLLLKQMIYIYNSHKNNNKIEELINNILSEMPLYLNSEKCLTSMAKYLSSNNDIQVLEIFILSIENFAKNYRKKTEGVNKKLIPLQNLLDFFIFEVFDLLKHQNNEIRKRALYCCLEIYTVVGKEFDPLVGKLPNAQQNLIRLYMKKRSG